MTMVFSNLKGIWARWGGWVEGGLVGLAVWFFLGRYDEHALEIGDTEHWLYEKILYALLMAGVAAAIGIAFRLRSALKQRDRALEAFRGSKDLHRHIIENANEMIFEVDMVGKITYVNKAAEQFMAMPAVDLLGRPYVDFVEPSHRDTVHREFVVQAARRISVQYVEAPAVSKGGKIIWFGQNVRLKMEENRPAGFMVISRDITERRQAEETLREREKTIRAIFDQAPLGMTLVDETGRFVTVNNQLVSILGYTREELLGKRFVEITHPEDILRSAGHYHDLLEGRIPSYQLVKRYLRKDGRAFWGRLTVSKLHLTAGTKTAAVGMIEDIDEWKRTEEQNAQMKSIIEETTDIVAMADPHGHLTYLNPAGRRLLGFDGNTAIMGLSSREFFPEDMIPELKENVQKRVVAEGRWKGRLELKSRDGSTVVVSQVILGHKNARGKVEYFSTIARDITREQAVLDELERERALLRTLIEAIPDEIAVKDKERRFILANSATVKALHQASIHDVLGKKDEDLIREPFATIAREEEEELLASGNPMFNRSSNPKRDPVTGKTLRALLVTKLPLKDKDGNVDKIVVVNRDVTEMRRAEDERELMISELQKALVDVKTLSGMLPICASCKKIRDDDGYWNKIESYIETHTAAQFSHGLCPECIGHYFPGSSGAKSGEAKKESGKS